MPETFPYKQARYFKQIPSSAEPRRIVGICLHSMESSEKPTTAESVADWFSRGPTNAAGQPVVTSPHYCIDNNSVIQCVQTKDIAYCAGRIGNEHFIHLELAGRANQTRQEWLDAYSSAVIDQAVRVCVVLVRKYNIPLRWLAPADLLSCQEAGWDAAIGGFTSHNNISKAFKQSTHWDPGPHFPQDVFLERLSDALA